MNAMTSPPPVLFRLTRTEEDTDSASAANTDDDRRELSSVGADLRRLREHTKLVGWVSAVACVRSVSLLQWKSTPALRVCVDRLRRKGTRVLLRLCTHPRLLYSLITG